MHDLGTAGLIFLMALLYSSVGHAGSSGYQAAMGLMGVSAVVMRPTALVLNILVATIGTIRFWRAGCYSWPLFWRFVIGSLPFAFIGGKWKLPDSTYYQLVGLVLLYAAYRLVKQTLPRRDGAGAEEQPPKPPPIAVGIGVGAGVGFLSGLTSTGGGIFVSPLIRLMRWADMKHTAGVSVAFILVNSAAGLTGQWTSTPLTFSAALPLWAGAAIVGGLIGSGAGSRRLNNDTLTRLLALVLIIAAGKLLFVPPGR